MPHEDSAPSPRDRRLPADAAAARRRRAYVPPELVLYGSLAELTRASGVEGFDGEVGSQQVG